MWGYREIVGKDVRLSHGMVIAVLKGHRLEQTAIGHAHLLDPKSRDKCQQGQFQKFPCVILCTLAWE